MQEPLLASNQSLGFSINVWDAGSAACTLLSCNICTMRARWDAPAIEAWSCHIFRYILGYSSDDEPEDSGWLDRRRRSACSSLFNSSSRMCCRGTWRPYILSLLLPDLLVTDIGTTGFPITISPSWIFCLSSCFITLTGWVDGMLYLPSRTFRFKRRILLGMSRPATAFPGLKLFVSNPQCSA